MVITVFMIFPCPFNVSNKNHITPYWCNYLSLWHPIKPSQSLSHILAAVMDLSHMLSNVVSLSLILSATVSLLLSCLLLPVPLHLRILINHRACSRAKKGIAQYTKLTIGSCSYLQHDDNPKHIKDN